MNISTSRFSTIIAGIILLGCALRLAACLNTCVINPDGVVYIHQARALYHGEWGGITAPGLTYLSIYSFLIAGVYFIAGDWIVSALAVSWFFGSFILFPVFLILRRFFDQSAAGLGLLLFAVMPVFVDISCAVIKEPVAVFIAAWGLHFFLRHLEEGALGPLFAAGICFLLASWARAEILAVFIVSWGFLFLFSPRRWQAASVFLVILAGLFAALAISGAVTGLGAEQLLRSRRTLSFFSDFFQRYDSLRFSIKELALAEGRSTVGFFLFEARNLLWFAALGATLKCFVKTLFYPLAVFFAAGLPGAWRLIRRDKRALYLAAVGAVSFAVLYFHEMTRWYIFPRYMAFMTLALMFVSCSGIAAAGDFLIRRLRVGKTAVICILALILVSSTLPKNLRARECDKVVFKEIGETAAAAGGGAGPVIISASAENQRWVPFYANIQTPGAFHPGIFNNSWENFPRQSREEFVSELHKRKIMYLLLDRRNWPDKYFPVDELLDLPGVDAIGRWNHPDTGEMILLKFPEKN